MMKLWERNGAPPHVDGAPGAGTRPYLVLCHRPPEDAASSGRGDAPGELDTGDGATDDLDLDGRREAHAENRTAIVYQWVRISR